MVSKFQAVHILGGLADTSYYICIKEINNKVLLYNKWKYIEYPVINHNGNKCEKKRNICVCIYSDIYIYLNHWAIHQKLTHNIVNQLHTSIKKKSQIKHKTGFYLIRMNEVISLTKQTPNQLTSKCLVYSEGVK